ncbi:MAG: hypothetical protein EA377_00545, partial [Phycisphaerales bacterium]
GGLLGDLDAALKVDLQAGDVVHIRISGTWPIGGSNGNFLFQVDFAIDDDQPTGCLGDLNEDGVVNVLDLLLLLENWGACPPECGAAGTGDCCESNDTPFCDDATCCAQVCADDPFCCDTSWDGICASTANNECEICQPEPDCGVAGTGNCCESNGTPFCDDAECCEAVCAFDSFCCDTNWDSICASFALDECDICQGAAL